MEAEAARFLRALRGRRSQVAWARRLGFRANPITNWERGQRFPTAQAALRAAALGGCDVAAAFAAFSPSTQLEQRDGQWQLAHWLEQLRGNTAVQMVAQRAGRSRFSVSRWLRGHAEPRLPDFFRLVDALTGRLPEWVAGFVPIESVPSLAQRHARASAARHIAFDAPWSEALLRLLETARMRELPHHDAALLAQHSDIPLAEVQRCLELLLEAGLVRRVRGQYHVSGTLLVDTRGGRQPLRRLKAHWCDVAAARLRTAQAAGDLFAYNVISVAARDLEPIREILRGAFREVRTLVAASEPAETVALLNLQLLELFPRGPGAER